MKKLFAIFLILAMIMTTAAALAEETAETPTAVIAANTDYENLTIGVVTPLNGDFFTDMWGNNTSDMDVRSLLHGYALTAWQNDSASYQIDPSVVTGIAVTKDEQGNYTYTIVIADDLLYSDGTPITAADYVFSILLSLAPEMAAIGANTSAADYILGIDEYLSGESDALRGLRLIDDNTLALTVKASYEPYFYDLNYLSYSPYPIGVIAPGCEIADDGNGAYIRNIEGEEQLFTAENLEKTIMDAETGYKSHPSVVSGPYVLKKYNADEHTAEFELNSYYKGNTEGMIPGIKTLTVVPVTNENMFEMLQNANVDVINKVVMADSIAEGLMLANEEQYEVQNYARTGLSFIAFNCSNPGIESEAVRKAIYQCLDKDTFLRNALGSYGLSVDAFYGVGQWMFQLVNKTLSAPTGTLAEDATDEEKAAYDELTAEWNALSMDSIPVYTFDVDAAIAELEADGWTLNENGEAFDAQSDTVRCRKNEAGEIEKLSFRLVAADTSTLIDELNADFVANLAKAGISVTIETVPAGDLFAMYYKTADRDYDMLLLASNFSPAYDPAPLYAYSTDTDGNIIYGQNNYSTIADEQLYNLALNLRSTQPGDTLNYCRRWIEFQTRWAEVLPAIPLYSNVYFDFYTATLHDYDIRECTNWPEAIYNAYLGDVIVSDDEQEDTTEITID